MKQRVISSDLSSKKELPTDIFVECESGRR